MRVEINPRGNGACPLCEKNGTCRIQKTLNESVTPFPDRDTPMELVVYSCPHFKEKG
jgi:hypothetical protein